MQCFLVIQNFVYFNELWTLAMLLNVIKRSVY